ncbi:thioesterase-like superfamily-domain-containing protein [Russula earlei]|uniref:Thioesterase-like superfamily-domain-containing protein n=1 Tax=Russula earlei TaxID=71964 RepID=A0ACC0TZG5_9AGAM|nr:thioesterase-like superfamily-domain-containing protein [Russula earlei]
MAPFSVASKTCLTYSDNSGVGTYTAALDPEWTIGPARVPNGGYLLGIVIEATAHFQSDSTHKDPLHLTAHFLRPLSVGLAEVRVRRLRSGQGFTHLSAELVQGSEPGVTSHLVYGVIDPGEPPANESFALRAPAPKARWTPFRMLPSRAVPLEWPDAVNFHGQILISRDNSVAEHHERLAAGEGPGGVEDGRLYELHPGEHISSSILPVICDVFPGLLPAAVQGVTLGPNWFPTVTMAIEFKAPIPQGIRTVGVFAAGRFIENPQGRHELYTEVWTAPANITDRHAQLPDNWREGQRCLAVAHQMALVATFQRWDKGSAQQKL